MKRALLLLVVLFSGFLGYSQWEIGFGATFASPVDRFIDSKYQSAWGFFGNITTRNLIPASHIHQFKLGFYFDGMQAGIDDHDIELADPVGAEGKLELTNGHNGQSFIGRYVFQWSPNMSLFTDAIVGHRKFYSNITTGLREYDENYADDISREHTWHTLRYGVGFGTRYNIGRSFGLELRAAYTRGNEATYFDLNATERDGNDVLFVNEQWDHTDLFLLTVGLNFKLFRANSTTSTRPSTPTRAAPANPNPSNYYYYNPRPRPRRSSSTPAPAREKKKVTPKGEVKEKPKKEEEKINW
jgi:hypothetical protein